MLELISARDQRNKKEEVGTREGVDVRNAWVS